LWCRLTSGKESIDEFGSEIDEELDQECIDDDYRQLNARLVLCHKLILPWEKYLASANRSRLFQFAGRSFVSACHAAEMFADEILIGIRFFKTEAKWSDCDWTFLRDDPPIDPEPILAGIRREALCYTGVNGPRGPDG
jgi:hypothetical protein